MVYMNWQAAVCISPCRSWDGEIEEVARGRLLVSFPVVRLLRFVGIVVVLLTEPVRSAWPGSMVTLIYYGQEIGFVLVALVGVDVRDVLTKARIEWVILWDLVVDPGRPATRAGWAFPCGWWARGCRRARGCL
jgi:hypothetical protein